MSTLSQAVKFDINLLHKYNQPVPRYTSYPPATELNEDFDEMDFRGAIALGNLQKTPLSLYAHIPFCDEPCYFCGCNTVISNRKEIAEPYLGYLIRHIAQDKPIQGNGGSHFDPLNDKHHLSTTLCCCLIRESELATIYPGSGPAF